MDVEIHLQPEWRECLLSRVSKKAGIHTALEKAVELLGGIESPDEFVVTCDETEVPVLRQAAQVHCPPAVQFIDFAVQRSALYRSNRRSA
ncbi:MAG TPA: hypothetical protein VGL70_06955 [Candidatus Binatia bacterium]|jgi:hypothetical protein